MRRKDRQVTDTTQIESIIQKCEVCRLGMCDGKMPYVVPMNFGYDMDGESLTLYFHCTHEGKKLDILRKNPLVCFEMDCGHSVKKGDRACDYSYTYESVIGSGHAVFVNNHEEKEYALKKIMAQYAGTDDFTFTEKETGLVEIIKIKADEYDAKSSKKS